MNAELQEDPVREAPDFKVVAGSAKFDWIMIFLCSWLLAGVYIDGWAHNHFNIIDTFFTPWHAVLYSGFLSIAIFLMATLARNMRKGYPWWSAVPPGYGFSLVGVVVFGIGGISDFFWHTLFGFDVELATLLSPTHLLLAAGGLLIVSGPLRAAWLRPETATQPGRFSQFPLIISLTFVLAALAFMTSFAHPFVSLPATSGFKPAGYSNYIIYLTDLVETWGVVSILLQSGLLVGAMLLILRRQRVPRGTFTVMLSISLAIACVLLGNYVLLPVAILSGVAADVFYWLLKPSVERVGTLRLYVFVVPVCLYTLYFLDLRLFKNVWWPLTIWSGSIFLAGIVGLLLSYLFVPPLRNGAKSAPPFLSSIRLTRRRVVIGLSGLGLALGGLVVAGDLLLHRTLAPGTAGFFETSGEPTNFYASSSQAIVSIPDFLYQASSAANSVAWSPDGKWIASAHSDGTVQVWPATVKAGASDKRTALFTYRKHSQAAIGLAWSPDGKYIASASDDGTVQVWNASTGLTLLTYRGHNGRVFAVAWSHDSSRLASAGEDTTVQIWSAATGAHIFTYQQHAEAVLALAWSPDNKRIASASVKGNALVWNAITGTLSTAFAVDDPKNITVTIMWSPDGKYIATARTTLSIWDASQGTLLYQYQDTANDIMSFAWSPNSKRFVTGQADGSVYIWNSFQSQKSVAPSSHAGSYAKVGGDIVLSGGGGDSSSFLLLCLGHSGAVNAVAWSPDSQHVVSAGVDSTLQVWDTFIGNTRITYRHNFASADWSPDGKRIASIVGKGIVEIWDAATATELVTYKKHPSSSAITCLAWSPDGKRMISASDDGTILIWDAQTGTTLLFATKQTQNMVYVTWLSGGKHVAMIDGDGVLQVWDAASGHLLKRSGKHSTGVSSAVYSPDERRIAIADKNGQVHIWDAMNGTILLAPLPFLRGVTNIAWAPDGKRLASVAGELVQVWDAMTGTILFSYQDGQSSVSTLAWSRDSKHLAFSSIGGVQIWDITLGMPLLTYQGLSVNTSWFFAASWSPDGKSMASTSNDGSVQVWSASPV